MSDEMLFAPAEIESRTQKNKLNRTNFHNKLHDLAMRDTPTLEEAYQVDREFDLTIFEGVLTGELDHKNPNTVAILESVHKRLAIEEDLIIAKKSKET